MRGTRPELMRSSRGARFGGETMTVIPATATLRPLRDVIIVEPEDVIYSRYIAVRQLTKPLKGTVLAVGPGHYPKRYDHPDKHKRTKTWDSKRFQPTELKVGDKVELGGAEIEGYAHEQFWWGDKRVLFCREADVAAVHETSPARSKSLAPRSATRRQAVHKRHIQGDAARG